MADPQQPNAERPKIVNTLAPSDAPVGPAPDLGPGESIRIGEEFGTAKKSLPSAKIVLIVLAIGAVVLGLYTFRTRAVPQGSGSVESVTSAEVEGQNIVLVALTVTMRNAGEKPLWIHTIKGTLKANGQDYSDDAASPADFARYFQAFPALKVGSQPGLLPETKLRPGEEVKGTVIVSFPVTQDAFNQRQSVSVVIQPYDQPLPVVLTK